MVAAAALAANSIYLAMVTFFEWTTGRALQDYFYQWMFLAHLALGLLVVVPFAAFAIAHALAARHHPNRRRCAHRLLLAALALACSSTGLVLVRVAGFELRRSACARQWRTGCTRWCPSAAAGRSILAPAARAAASASGAAWGVVRSRRRWRSRSRSCDAHQPTARAACRTKAIASSPVARADADRAAAAAARADDGRATARDATPTPIRGWLTSAHHFSSFNNPVYLASVKETRKVVLAARRQRATAAGGAPAATTRCRFFSGAFDEPKFDTEEPITDRSGRHHLHRRATPSPASTAPAATATTPIEEPLHYPFAFSDKPALQCDQPAAGEGQAGVPHEDVPQAGAPHVRSSAPPATRCTSRASSTTTRSSCAARTTTTASS